MKWESLIDPRESYWRRAKRRVQKIRIQVALQTSAKERSRWQGILKHAEVKLESAMKALPLPHPVDPPHPATLWR